MVLEEVRKSCPERSVKVEKQVIVIQGKPYTIFNDRDFLDLVYKFMGYDAMKALREYLEDIDTEIEDLKSQIQEVEDDE